MGCRKYKGEAFFDDLTRETHLPEELERMVFVFDGEAFEIDLTDENAQQFRDVMERYKSAARPTSKARVLATLPKKRRHLKAVPDVPLPAPEGEPENASFPQKGETVEARTEPEGTRVPESPSEPSEIGHEEPALKPALKVVPPSAPNPIPDDWAPYAPERGDDKPAKVRKVRSWATAMGMPAHETLTPKVFARWEEFYRAHGWARL